MFDDQDGCEWVSFFWYQFTWVVPDQRPLKVLCVCVSVLIICPGRQSLSFAFLLSATVVGVCRHEHLKDKDSVSEYKTLCCCRESTMHLGEGLDVRPSQESEPELDPDPNQGPGSGLLNLCFGLDLDPDLDSDIL